MEENVYYNYDRIISYNALLNILIGERGVGKTFGASKLVTSDFIKRKRQFVYLRRYKTELSKSFKKFFEALKKENEFPEHKLETKGLTFLIDDEVAGYGMTLSTAQQLKSSNFPDVYYIIFDEFLTKHLYLNDEFVLFMNTISTIVRKRTDVKIYMLGNTVSKYSPYFEEMGLNHVQDMEQGTIDVYSYGDSKLTVAVEYCKSNDSSKENSFYFAFNNPKLAMITGGAWEMDIYPHLPIKYTPKNVLLEYYIDFNDKLYTCEIVLVGEVTFTYIHRKTTDLHHNKNDIIYTTEHYPNLNYSRNIFKPINKVQEQIKWYYMTDRVYYQNNSVGDEINTMLKIMSRQ